MKYEMNALSCSLKKWNITLTEIQLIQFTQYYELLLEWNSFMNLTAITELQEVIDKHFVDSLTIANYISLKDQTILDLGTGAGFPGIPIKIMYPNVEIVLLDSLNKRIKFLDAVIEKLQLQNVRAVHGRAEDLSHQITYREQFDICTSRAVANLSTLSEYCIPFVKEGGYFISYKTETAKEEISEAKRAVCVLGGKIEKIEELKLPNTNMGRTLVIIKKIGRTKSKYPRKAGIPSKEPIN
ncbi:MAG: 16S rRNA (guanine(527)-N(7))-methyltransferase RsmG [Lachnospiraceae bacterium]